MVPVQLAERGRGVARQRLVGEPVGKLVLLPRPHLCRGRGLGKGGFQGTCQVGQGHLQVLEGGEVGLQVNVRVEVRGGGCRNAACERTRLPQEVEKESKLRSSVQVEERVGKVGRKVGREMGQKESEQGDRQDCLDWPNHENSG